MNQRPRSLVRDLCETQTAECCVSRKRVIGGCLLLGLLARGENRLFSPESPADLFLPYKPLHCPLSSFRFFLPPTTGERVILSLVDSFPQVFRLRRKTLTEQKGIASGWKIKFGAIRGSRAAYCDLCKTGAAERSVFPKGGECSAAAEKNCFLSGTEGKQDFPLKVRPIYFCGSSL